MSAPAIGQEAENGAQVAPKSAQKSTAMSSSEISTGNDRFSGGCADLPEHTEILLKEYGLHQDEIDSLLLSGGARAAQNPE